jgi:hypothetical protein
MDVAQHRFSPLLSSSSSLNGVGVWKDPENSFIIGDRYKVKSGLF